MQKNTIEYLTYTWNPIAMRCARVSDGCLNCWHMRTAYRLSKNHTLPESERRALAGSGPFILRERELSSPMKVRTPSVIGVQFMGDLYNEAVPTTFIDNVLEVMAACPQHTFLILTKRAYLMEKKIYGITPDHGCRALGGGDYLPNVWCGLTVCNQREVDEKIPVFLQVPGKKFLSIEPLLGPISLRWLSAWNGMATKPRELGQTTNEYDGLRHIDAVILGGETGPGARPMHPDWVRSVRDQCAAAGVPFFFKQWGEWSTPDQSAKHRFVSAKAYNCHVWEDLTTSWKYGRKHAGRILDGRTHDDLPWRPPLCLP